MPRRELASLALLAITALTVGVGCPEDQPTGGATGGTTKPPTTTKSAAPAPSAAPSAKPTAGGPAAPEGKGTIKGAVSFNGKAPEMKVPVKRKEAEFCKGKEVPYNAVVVKDGKLKDVLVRIENGGVKGKFDAPKAHAVINQVDCMYTPRLQGVVSGQEIDIKNSDGTLHNVHTYKGSESWFNQAQPKGSEAISKELEDTNIIKFTCDVHPWMRGFVVVTDHPFFAVTGDDGSFKIEKVPAGKYNMEAWHTRYGSKKGTVEVSDDKPGEVSFTFEDKDPEPDVNKDELKGLW